MCIIFYEFAVDSQVMTYINSTIQSKEKNKFQEEVQNPDKYSEKIS